MHKLRHLYLILIGVSGFIINSVYAYDTSVFLFSEHTAELTKEIYISAFAMQVSWAILFFWYLFSPYKRRIVLLISLVPMIIANTLFSLTLRIEQMLSNTLVLMVFIAVHISGYLLAQKYINKEI